MASFARKTRSSHWKTSYRGTSPLETPRRKAGERSEWANENPRETQSRHVCAGWPSLWEGEVSVCFTALCPVGLFLSCWKWLWLQGWLGSVPSLSVDLVALDKSSLSLLLFFWDTDTQFWPVRVNSFSQSEELCILYLYLLGPLVPNGIWNTAWFSTSFHLCREQQKFH